MRRLFFIILALFIGLIVLLNQARLQFEQPWFNDIHVQETYTLSADSSDVVVFASQISLPAGTTVTGDVALLGAEVEINNRVTGDVTVMGERVTLAPEAQITGDVNILTHHLVLAGRIDGSLSFRGDALTLSPDAVVSGPVFACADQITDQRSAAPAVRPCDESRAIVTYEGVELAAFFPLLGVIIDGIGPAAWLGTSVLGALALSAVAILAVVLFPRQISHIEEAIRTHPRRLSGAGFTLLLLAVGLSFALAVVWALIPPLGLLLMPAYLVGGFLLIGMIVTGWVTIGLLVGDVLLRRFIHHDMPPLVAAAAGMFVVALTGQLLLLLPFGAVVGLLVGLLVGSVGLGAALLTRMGTRPLHHSYLVQG